MTIQAPNWYREKIRSKVRKRYQSMGGYLDGTMTQGDGGAGSVKFPVYGRVETYELSGSIQNVPNTNPNLGMVEVSMRDFEGSVWMRVQDARRQGPNEQEAVGRMLYGGIRRRRDNLRLEAAHTFVSGVSALQDAPTTPLTIGDGTGIIDFTDLMHAIDHVMGAGGDDEENMMFWPIPYTWMSQLEMYEEIRNADYAGPKDLPFARAQRLKKRTVRGCHLIGMPNEHFTVGTGAYTGNANAPFTEAGYIDTVLWGKDAMGFEMEWNQEDMSLSMHPEKEGTPMLGKVGLSGAALGILPEGVVRMRFKAQNKAVRPA